MRPATKQSRQLQREETVKVEIARLEKEILELTGRKREEGMKAYRQLLLSSADQLIYFMRS